jgi:hypothetical protein
MCTRDDVCVCIVQMCIFGRNLFKKIGVVEKGGARSAARG